MMVATFRSTFFFLARCAVRPQSHKRSTMKPTKAANFARKLPLNARQ